MGIFKKLNINAIKSTVEAGVKTAQESVANFNAEEALKGAADAVAVGKTKVMETVGNAINAETSTTQEEPSYKELVALMWYLAYADGAISDPERAKIDDFARDIDENYESYADTLEQECSERLMSSAREFGQQNAAKIEAQKVVDSLKPNPREAKLLCWNLLALASVDGLSDDELDFIRFTSEKSGLKEDVFAELKNYNDALIEVGEARESLRMSDRSYATIEPIMNEFTQREQVIIEAAQALVFDL